MRKKDLVCIFVISELIFVCLAFIYFNLEKAVFESAFLGKIFWLLRKLKVIFVLPVLIPTLAYLGIWFGFLVSKKSKTFFEFVKFFLVGVSNTFLDLGVLNLLILIFSFGSGIYYSLFKAISFLVAVSNSYFWNRSWVFESKGKDVKKEGMKFFLVSVGGLIVNVTIASLVVNLGGKILDLPFQILGNLGALGAVVGSMFWNFFGYKFFVFKK